MNSPYSSKQKPRYGAIPPREVEYPISTVNELRGSKPLFSEFFLFTYISSMLVVLSAPHYNQLSNYFGIVVAAVCLIEIGIVRYPTRILSILRPLIGIGIFTLIVAASVFYLPEAFPYVRRAMQLLVLITIVFLVVRVTGRITSVSAGFAVGVLILAPTVFRQADFLMTTGMRLELDVFGGGEEGLNPNGYGIILNIAILLGIHEIFSNRRRKSLIMKSVVTLCFITVIAIAVYQIVFFLGSRQNQLWLMITVFAVAIIAGRGRFTFPRILAGSFLSAFMLGLILFLMRDSPHFERLVVPVNVVLHGDSLDGSNYTRLMYMQSGIMMWIKSPVWGHGIAGFQLYSGMGTYSHNMFIEILANYGLLGFLTFFSYHYFVLKRSILVIRRRIPAVRVEMIWVIISFVGIAVSHMFRPTLYDKPMFIFLGTIGGLALYIFSRCESVYQLPHRDSQKGHLRNQ